MKLNIKKMNTMEIVTMNLTTMMGIMITQTIIIKITTMMTE
jgi:hypothetical protein